MGGWGFLRLRGLGSEVLPDGVELVACAAFVEVGELGAAFFIGEARHLGFGINAQGVEEPALEVVFAQALGGPCEVDARSFEDGGGRAFSYAMAGGAVESAILGEEGGAVASVFLGGRWFCWAGDGKPVGVGKAVCDAMADGRESGHACDQPWAGLEKRFAGDEARHP